MCDGKKLIARLYTNSPSPAKPLTGIFSTDSENTFDIVPSINVTPLAGAGKRLTAGFTHPEWCWQDYMACWC